MRIGCVGAGPAGLYFAICMKRRDPGHEIEVFERDPAGVTYGWGVTLWADLLAKLQGSDPESALEIRDGCFRWEDQVVHIQGKGTAHLRGASGFSISRRVLLEILTRRATDLGARVEFECGLDDLAELADYDLIVACDGVNSRLRRLHADRFETNVHVGRNKYVWLGTTRVFDTFTYAFVETEAGWIWFYAYGFDGATSTCIVECSPATWAGLGLETLGTHDSIEFLSMAFEPYLDGHPLMVQARDPEGMPWVNFRTVTNRRWHHERVVLTGDAAHTTHFSIGSGTRLAIEDAIALADRLQRHGRVGAALEAYAGERQAALDEPLRRARRSARWFESIHRYVELEAPQFATMLARRRRFSRLLAKMPARWHWRLYQAARKATLWLRRGKGAGSEPGGMERGAG